jgi:hypothetical protein
MSTLLNNGIKVTINPNGMLWVQGTQWSTGYVIEPSGNIRPALASEAINDCPNASTKEPEQ